MKYFLDHKVLELLLKTNDQKVIDSWYEDIIYAAGVATETVVNQFLKKHGIVLTYKEIVDTPEENIDPKVRLLLLDADLAKEIEDNVQGVYKLLFNELIKKLSNVEKEEVISYMNENNQILESSLDATAEGIELLQQMSRYITPDQFAGIVKQLEQSEEIENNLQ